MIQLNELICYLDDVKAKSFGKIVVEISRNDAWRNNKDNPKEQKPIAKYITKNILTSLDFTFANFQKIFSASEFWQVLKTSIY